MYGASPAPQVRAPDGGLERAISAEIQLPFEQKPGASESRRSWVDISSQTARSKHSRQLYTARASSPGGRCTTACGSTPNRPSIVKSEPASSVTHFSIVGQLMATCAYSPASGFMSEESRAGFDPGQKERQVTMQ